MRLTTVPWRAALRASDAEAAIDELTSLPKTPSELPAYAAGDRKLRIEAGGNLRRAALACGVGCYIQQSSGFFLEVKGALADEGSPPCCECQPGRCGQCADVCVSGAAVLESSMEASRCVADSSMGRTPGMTRMAGHLMRFASSCSGDRRGRSEMVVRSY
jgi:hypothetical protein